MSEASTAMAQLRQAALTLLATWMSERFFRTFRPVLDERSPFDALLVQRERLVGVTFGLLWEHDQPAGAGWLETQLGADLEERGGAYVIWVPPGAELPTAEPRQSELRIVLSRGLTNLKPGERREVRLPIALALAKVDAEGAYMSVNGPLSAEWTTLSEGIGGAFHLDARALRRLPEERAELELVISQIRDRAAMLELGEVTPVETHDYWLVSRLPGDEPAGVVVFGSSSTFDASDGATVRRLMRAHLHRAGEQREAAEAGGKQPDMTALLLGAPLGHIEEEMATAALRGMSPAAYGSVNLVALVADGTVRQLLQPRSLPWEERSPQA